MPTMPASGEMASRMRVASSCTSDSGSGSLLAMGLRGVEIALQDEGCGEGIDVAGLSRARAGLAQLRLGGGRGERLVHEDHRKAIACRQPPREFLRQPRDRVRRIVGVARAAHDEAGGLPLGYELPDSLEAGVVARRIDVAHGIGDADRGLADGDPDATLTVIEADERPAQRHACPASSERLAAFTPRACIAASYLASGGVLKMRSRSAR